MEAVALIATLVLGGALMLGGLVVYCRRKRGLVPGICGALLLLGIYIYAFIRTH